jgi:hypothetical protein
MEVRGALFLSSKAEFDPLRIPLLEEKYHP